VNVGMEQQVLPLCMQDAKETNLRSPVFWVACHVTERFGNYAEQEIVKRHLILQDGSMQLVRHGEDDVGVTRLKQFLTASVHPTLACLGLPLVAMPIAAAVVGDDWGFLAVRTNIGVTARRCGAAPRNSPDNFEIPNNSPRCKGVFTQEPIATQDSTSSVRWLRRQVLRMTGKH